MSELTLCALSLRTVRIFSGNHVYNESIMLVPSRIAWNCLGIVEAVKMNYRCAFTYGSN